MSLWMNSGLDVGYLYEFVIEFDVGYLYEFVVELSNDLHLNIRDTSMNLWLNSLTIPL